uniref:Uncharacterized protein n=1 Tax=Cacopsylla melanoneura TaxID=428564 RepID=A0A8D8X0A7_9HEMI
MAVKKIAASETAKKFLEQDPTEVEFYLKRHISHFHEYKTKVLDKINHLYDMNQENFVLRQKLHSRNDQLFQIKSSVSDLQFALIQQQDQNLSLLKENDQLRLRLADYQKKVQILLAYANIPDDFPILSLVTSKEPGNKLESLKPTPTPNQAKICQCTIHKNLTDPIQRVCATCGKYVSSSENQGSEIHLDKCSGTSQNRLLHRNKLKPKHSDLSVDADKNFISDIDQANLIIQSLKSELNEVKYNYDAHIDLLVQDIRLQRDEHKAHLDNYSEDCDYYNTYVKNLHRVLYKYLYEDMCSQQTDASYLGELCKYAVCVQKCRQLLGDKFPQCIKQYLNSPGISESNTASNSTDLTNKLETLTKELNKYKESNIHLELKLSSQKLKQGDNLINMNERIELYKKKHDEMLARKNQECKLYRKQIDELIRELNERKGERYK